MRYVLVTHITQSNLPAAYNTIYTFRKYHQDAHIYTFGEKPNAILKALDVGYIEYSGTLYEQLARINNDAANKHHTGILLSNKYDAIVVADAGVLFTRSIKNHVLSSIVNNRVLGTTEFNDRLYMDPSFYIVPSKLVDEKLQRSVISGLTMGTPNVALVDAYYPVLDTSISKDIFVVKPGMTLIHTTKSIVKYADNAWESVTSNDLWNEITEEFMRSIYEKSIRNN